MHKIKEEAVSTTATTKSQLKLKFKLNTINILILPNRLIESHIPFMTYNIFHSGSAVDRHVMS